MRRVFEQYVQLLAKRKSKKKLLTPAAAAIRLASALQAEGDPDRARLPVSENVKTDNALIMNSQKRRRSNEPLYLRSSIKNTERHRESSRSILRNR